jgi:hypothetical protein
MAHPAPISLNDPLLEFRSEHDLVAHAIPVTHAANAASSPTLKAAETDSFRTFSRETPLSECGQARRDASTQYEPSSPLRAGYEAFIRTLRRTDA